MIIFEKVIRFGDRRWVRVGNTVAGTIAVTVALVMLVIILVSGCQVHQCDPNTQRCSHQGSLGGLQVERYGS